MNKSIVLIAVSAGLAASGSGGLAGAARIGSPLPLPFRVASGLRSPAPDILNLSGAIQLSSISMAASGAAALLSSESTRRLQFVACLAAAPRALDPIDLSFLGASPAAIGRLRGACFLPGRDAALAETGEILLIAGWIPLAAEAEDYDPLDSSLFALNRAGAAPLLLLDAAKRRSVWFVAPVHPPARPRGHGKNLTRGEDQP